MRVSTAQHYTFVLLIHIYCVCQQICHKQYPGTLMISWKFWNTLLLWHILQSTNCVDGICIWEDNIKLHYFLSCDQYCWHAVDAAFDRCGGISFLPYSHWLILSTTLWNTSGWIYVCPYRHHMASVHRLYWDLQYLLLESNSFERPFTILYLQFF